MSDLIRREDVIATLCFCEETKMMLCKDLRKILEKINDIPSAEPERKNGEWKPFDLTWGRSVYSCTACGEAMDIPTEMSKPIYNFCPSCGAKMTRGDR